ncbi:alternate-type signal peptide domain-containing protein [Rhodococcus erythropolis]
MKKTTKGTLAVGAAAILLMGGMGSLALWNDSEAAPADTITNGELDIALVGEAGVWTDISPDSNAPGVIDPAVFRMVPGDVLQYDASFLISADGDNLAATITADQQSITRSAGLTELNTPVVVTALVNGEELPATTITEANDGDTVDVRITLTFDPSTAGQVGQKGTVGLDEFRVNLQQVRP